jgi:two-component system response regulator FixJ
VRRDYLLNISLKTVFLRSIMLAERIVHIVDDSPAVLRALERLLNTANFAVKCYESPRDFLQQAGHSSEGCVILDLRMPDLDGLQVQARLREMGSRLPVIFLTAYGNVKAAVQAMKAGAIDFVEKPIADKVLFAAIDKALEWGSQQAAELESRRAARRIAALTPRERLVLNALLEGRQNDVVASDLGVSVRAVEAQRKMLLQHLGVAELSQAIRLGVIAQLQRLRSSIR